jgi:tRNA uridine 5-carbamoylmethylation protein Kti12
VDGSKNGKIKLDDIADKDLPEVMQKMTKEQRRAYVDEQAKTRGELQKQINDLNTAREKFVADKRREEAKSGADTLDAAVLKAVREQMQKKEFTTEAK